MTASAPAPSRLRPLVILEDDTGVAELMQRILTSEGYEVHLARSGTEALAALEALSPRPCVLVSDLQLPGETGDTFLLRLWRERHALFCATRFLVVSAADALPPELGVLGVPWVRKPFRLQELTAAVAPLAREA